MGVKSAPKLVPSVHAPKAHALARLVIVHVERFDCRQVAADQAHVRKEQRRREDAEQARAAYPPSVL
jgi:hypothetical protein